jgi:type IV pilus assembly protein PilV
MSPDTRTGSARPDSQQGFSLIEVLVALLVLSIGLLGLAALQTTSLKYNTESYFRTQATYFVYDIVDRMRINSAAVASGGAYDVSDASAVSTLLSDYGTCRTSSCDCDNTSCNSTDLATYDLGKWYDRMNAILPGAKDNPATIAIDASKKVTITVNWQERDLGKTQTWEIQL